MIEQMAPYALAYTAPLLITALGGLVSERSGVVNIGLEGLMLVGAFAGALVISMQQSVRAEQAVWIGLAAGAGAGALFSMLHAFASITLNANQVISGTAVNILAGSLTVFVCRTITGSGVIGIEGLSRFDAPLLSGIPHRGAITVYRRLFDYMVGHHYIGSFLVRALPDSIWFAAQGLRGKSPGC